MKPTDRLIKKYTPQFILILALLSGTHATAKDWVTDNTGNWEDGTNWIGGLPAGNGDPANIEAGNIELSSTVTGLTQLNLATLGATSLVNLRLNNGAYLEAGAPIQIGNNSGGTATIELNGISGNRSTLEVERIDVNANANGAQLTFDGGRLRAGNAATGQLLNNWQDPVQINSGGAFIDSNGRDISISAQLTGNGRLTKEGNGTLTLTGEDLQLGDLNIVGGNLDFAPDDGNAQAGAVAIATNSTLGIGDGDWVLIDSLSGAGNVLLRDSLSTLSIMGNTDTVFTGNINGDGDLLVEGNSTLTLRGGNHTIAGILSVCNCSVEPGGLVIDGGSLTAGIGITASNGLITFANNAQIVTGDIIIGPLGKLQINQDASVDVSGDTLIMDQGVLIANGTLTGSLLLSSGATLSGSGSVENLTDLSGATFAPGNSIGTFTISGDLTFNENSRYEVEVDPASTASDRIHVGGLATLAGSVIHVGQSGNYRALSEYTILTADGGISGEFDSVSSNFAFLDSTLGYTSNAVTLLLERNNIDFASTARTPNQRATAIGLESTGSGSAYDAVVGLSAEQAPAAFDALSGEAHASAQSMLQQQARNLPRHGLTLMRSNFNTGSRSGALTASTSSPASVAAMPRSNAYPAWVALQGQDSNVVTDDNAAGVDLRSYGLQMGGDMSLGRHWRLGGAFGYADQDLRIHDRNSTVKADSYQLALYAGRDFTIGAGRAHLIGGTSWTHHEIDSKRRVNFSNFNETIRANYHARTLQFFTEAGYTLPLTKQLAVTPYLAFEWSEQRTNSFQEQGGNAALTAESSRNRVRTMTLGLEATHHFTWGEQAGTLTADLGWRHANGDLTAKSRFTFSGGLSFTVAGAPVSQNAAVLGVGLNLAMSDQA